MSKSPKVRLPKTLAGIKVPKSLREPGWLDGLVSSQSGREALAEALLKGAEAAAAALVAYKPEDQEAARSEEGGRPNLADSAPAGMERITGEAPKGRGRRRAKAGPGVDPGRGEPDQSAAPSAGT